MTSKTSVVLICAAIGFGGGALSTVFTSMTPGLGVAALGAIYGAVFALLSWRRATSPGAGLLWGLAYALLLWLLLPAGILPLLNSPHPAMGMLDAAREHFPELVAYIVCIGLPLGVVLGTLAPRISGSSANASSRQSSAVRRRRLQLAARHSRRRHRRRCGRMGFWQVDGASELLSARRQHRECQLARDRHHGCTTPSRSSSGSVLVLLFQRDVRGHGSSMGWGMAYGLLWWFVGPLTVLPSVAGQTARLECSAWWLNSSAHWSAM